MTADRRARLIAFAIEAATYLGWGWVSPAPAAPTPGVPSPVIVAAVSRSSPDRSPAGHLR